MPGLAPVLALEPAWLPPHGWPECAGVARSNQASRGSGGHDLCQEALLSAEPGRPTPSLGEEGWRTSEVQLRGLATVIGGVQTGLDGGRPETVSCLRRSNFKAICNHKSCSQRLGFDGKTDSPRQTGTRAGANTYPNTSGLGFGPPVLMQSLRGWGHREGLVWMAAP